MADRVTPIKSPREVLDAVHNHIRESRARHALSVFVRSFLTELNKRPMKPTVRLKPKLEAGLRETFPAGGVSVRYYAPESSWTSDSWTWRLEFVGVVNEVIGYQIKVGPDYVCDIDKSLMGHSQHALIADELTRKLPLIEERCAAFNTALKELQDIAAFAMPGPEAQAAGLQHFFPLFPLSRYFCYYELKTP